MKCVCPMGGERTCPDDCPLAVWAALSVTDRKAQRKSIVEKLARQGFPQEQIATQLGVSQKTISRDLATLDIMTNVEDRGKDTLGRRKSTGRPRNSKRSPELEARYDRIVTMSDAGVPTRDIAAAVGMTERGVSQELEHERIRRETRAEAAVDRSHLSLTAQEKFDAALRRAKHALNVQFERRVQDELKRALEDTVLPAYNKLHAKHEQVVKARKGVMDAATFRKILACLHPDRFTDPRNKAMSEEAFRLFNDKKLLLLGEKDHPTQAGAMPRTHAEWQEAKRRANEERKARRGKPSTPAHVH